jgi:hypothetical protein
MLLPSKPDQSIAGWQDEGLVGFPVSVDAAAKVIFGALFPSLLKVISVPTATTKRVQLPIVIVF